MKCGCLTIMTINRSPAPPLGYTRGMEPDKKPSRQFTLSRLLVAVFRNPADRSKLEPLLKKLQRIWAAARA